MKLTKHKRRPERNRLKVVKSRPVASDKTEPTELANAEQMEPNRNEQPKRDSTEQAESDTNEHSEFDKTKFLRIKEVLDLWVPFGRTTLWREIKAKRFPEAVKVAKGMKAFRRADVEDWVRKRTA